MVEIDHNLTSFLVFDSEFPRHLTPPFFKSFRLDVGLIHSNNLLPLGSTTSFCLTYIDIPENTLVKLFVKGLLGFRRTLESSYTLTP